MSSAARVATLVAVPVAALAFFLAFRMLSDNGGRGESQNTPRAVATAPVPISARNLPASQVAVCERMIESLPGALGDNARRPVTGGGAAQNAVYGDPAIIASCGVSEPVVLPTGQVWVLSRVCWYAAQTPASTVWTTVDRLVPLQVTVPNVYVGQGDLLQVLGGPIESTLETKPAPPRSCTS